MINTHAPPPMPPYQSIAAACRSTGLSQHYLRQGCRTGTVPHVMAGTKYLVDVPALLASLRTHGNADKEGA